MKLKTCTPPKVKAYARDIPELARALGRTYQGLYSLQKNGRFSKEKKGYHVEKIRAALARKRERAVGDEESRQWDRTYRMWRAKQAELHYQQARALLVDRDAVIREQVQRERVFIQEMRRFSVALPARLQHQPFVEWASLIDDACGDALSRMVAALNAKPT
jgi:hypothetical protein